MWTADPNTPKLGSDTSLSRWVLRGKLRLFYPRHGRFIVSRAWICFVILLFIWLDVHGAEPRRVLLLQSYGREFGPFGVFTSSFRQELAQLSPEPIDFFDVALATARFDDSDEAPFVDYLHALFKDRSIDLVVPMGGPAARFAQKYRVQLFPEVPMLLAAVDQRMFQGSALNSNDAVLATRHNPRQYIVSILHLLPNTTNLVIVFGSSSLERFWSDEFARAISGSRAGLGVEQFRSLSFEEMKSRAARLPPHSAMLFCEILVDAHGIPQTRQALRNLHAVANAPMFGMFDYQLGQGIVGGPLISIHELSHQSALAASRLLRGDAPADIRPPPLEAGSPTYDGRELKRWNISETSLPAGSKVVFTEPSAWELYKGRILALVFLLAAQASLISVLVVNLRRRKRVEAELRQSHRSMNLAADAAHMGLIVWETSKPEMWTSPKWKDLHGFDQREPVTFEKFLSRVHSEDRQIVEQSMKEALKRTGRFIVQHRVVLPDGQERWIAKTGRLERADDDGPSRVLGVALDVTEQVAAERKTHEMSGRLINAQEDERKRIARDLHDDLNQRLAMLSLEAEMLGRMNTAPDARPLITQIGTEVRSLATEVHNLSYQLHPAKLEQLGLVAAVRTLCQEQSKVWGMPIDFVQAEVPREVDRNTALALYRIIQEALQNIGKHSQATHTKVELTRHHDVLRLIIRDNGKGFDPENIQQHAGLGLLGIRERVYLVHGHSVIHSAPGQGTSIEVSVPIWEKRSSLADLIPPSTNDLQVDITRTKLPSSSDRLQPTRDLGIDLPDISR